ncbi:hypothetical protein BpHYR1_029784 [Brachionus plicatilis]|uniref:Uncharacterized protein n=1 Tax=Brachionus plicatilis TaxID=10195 RepID=A0A3M7RBM5_BRAPC|nr:hypothetical protein BpHYR1_029784 [Brachionus plicatilis]
MQIDMDPLSSQQKHPNKFFKPVFDCKISESVSHGRLVGNFCQILSQGRLDCYYMKLPLFFYLFKSTELILLQNKNELKLGLDACSPFLLTFPKKIQELYFVTSLKSNYFKINKNFAFYRRNLEVPYYNRTIIEIQYNFTIISCGAHLQTLKLMQLWFHNVLKWILIFQQLPDDQDSPNKSNKLFPFL